MVQYCSIVQYRTVRPPVKDVLQLSNYSFMPYNPENSGELTNITNSHSPLYKCYIYSANVLLPYLLSASAEFLS
jgi:hypothetical protein